MKHKLWTLLVLTTLFFELGCSKPEDTAELEDFSIAASYGRYLLSSDDKTVALVGVYIPAPSDANHDSSLFLEYLALIQSVELKLKVVEARHESGYPSLDLVEVYSNETNVNKYLLSHGLAFFNEDHWNRKEKKEYQRLEAEARSAKLGYWKNEESLQVQFLRPSKGRFVHYPGCPHVKDLDESDRVEYFAPVPQTPFMSIRNSYFCDYCRPKYDQAIVEANKLKVRLES